MDRLFVNHAGWFVAAGWLLLSFAIPIAVLSSVDSGIMLSYYPQHANAPLYRFIGQAFQVAILASIAAAVLPSIVLACRSRVIASNLVVGCWSLILACWLMFLWLGPKEVQRFIGLGPQQSERTIGAQPFGVPWPYKPIRVDETTDREFKALIDSQRK